MLNKILIIDDDDDFLSAMTVFLQSQDFEVVQATNGQEGFKKVKTENPDLILLDMMMTYKTEGAETAKAIADDAAIRDIPMILITGAKKEANFPIAIEAGDTALPVKEVIEKPVNPEGLLRSIQNCLKETGVEHREVISKLDRLVSKWDGKQGTLIMILHELQNRYGYVPRDISFKLSCLLKIPLARIYEVIPFYNYFKLEAPGKHTISVCMGTACYLKGTQQIMQELKNILKIEEGQTTKDGQFHLQAVRCLGCCGLAPVITIDEKVYGKVKSEDMMKILADYTNEK